MPISGLKISSYGSSAAAPINVWKGWLPQLVLPINSKGSVSRRMIGASGRLLCKVDGHAVSYNPSNSFNSGGGDDWLPEWRLDSDIGGDGKAAICIQGWCWGRSKCSSKVCESSVAYGSPVVSTIIVELDLDRIVEIELGGEGREWWSSICPSLSSSLMALRCARLICLLFKLSCVHEGRRALTIFPSASLQSLFLVARTPRPSPPASSSFSLCRFICLSLSSC